jgi:glycosyltransferase involved in cell wall biosynthesis
MHGVRIAVLNLNETQRDPRVRRISETMVRDGYIVNVFEMQQAHQAARDSFDGYEVVRVADPQSYTPADMQGIEQACAEVGTLLRKCDPAVMDGPEQSQRAGFWPRLWLAMRRHSGRLQAPVPEANPGTFNTLSEILAIRSIMLINLELYKAARTFQPQLVYCNDLDTLLAGLLLKIQHGCVLLFDAHEIYPEQLAEHMRSETWYHFYSQLEKLLLPFADGRLTVCDSLGDYFQRRYNTGPFLTLRNTPSIKYLPDESILERCNDPVHILYHGAYFQYRGLDEIIAIAGRVKQARFIFRGIGAYENALKAQVAARGCEQQVHFVPPVPIDALVSTASACDIGLNPFISVCLNTEYALPNKLFEYMMAGLAVANADLIEMRLLTQKLDNGVLFNSCDSESIVQSLNALISDRERLQAYRRKSYEASKTEFHWEHEEGKLKAYLRQFI